MIANLRSLRLEVEALHETKDPAAANALLILIAARIDALIERAGRIENAARAAEDNLRDLYVHVV